MEPLVFSIDVFSYCAGIATGVLGLIFFIFAFGR